MRETTKSTKSTLIKNSVRDANEFLCVVNILRGGSDEYSLSYLLVKAIVLYNKCQEALKRLAAFEPEPEIALEFYDFVAMGKIVAEKFKKSEQILFEFVEKNEKEIMDLFKEDGELVLRTQSLGKMLTYIQDMAEDGMLLRDYNWASEEMKDLAKDFIIIFTWLHEFAQYCPEDISGKKKFKDWKKGLKKIEKKLEKIYGIFSPVSSFIEKVYRAEYCPQYWWLSGLPKLHPLPERALTERDLELSLKLNLHKKNTGCPDEELVIAYALRELSGNRRKKIEGHVAKCPKCLDIVLSVRYAVD